MDNPRKALCLSGSQTFAIIPAKKNKLAGKRAQKDKSIIKTKTNTIISDYYQPFFTNKSVKKPLNFLQGKNVHLAKMALRRSRESERAWVVT